VTILNDFLSLSKLEEGKIKVRPEHFEIIEFLEALIEGIELTKKPKQKITVRKETPSVKVFLDPKLLSHILINLLSNAIKYSSDNKEITFVISKKEEQLRIEVIDQGIGIPLNDQKNLFQRFYRAGNASSIQGTGLGLHIVKQYTELMNGSISFKSELNKGSTFIVELPINKNKKL